ncbi:hypothetical protein CUJ86_02460 [Methanofollis fontis]|uniref:Uncharacterized protein n=1 Tax=Methanofollis fontis TaxID=2052832 RepID=A0A483CTC1_9EURY|nr:hypothetical protein CUJ86_02460 [Methanofollis fontis]
MLIVLLAAAAFLTLDIEITDAPGASSFPYTTTYNVWFPDGEAVTIGNARMMALSYDDELIFDVNGNRQKLVVGEEKQLGPYHASVRVFGIELLDTDFRMLMKYIGMAEGKANFHMAVQTSGQVPQFVIDRLLPRDIQAEPV